MVTALPVISTVIELPAANAYRKQSLPAPVGAGGESIPGVQTPPYVGGPGTAALASVLRDHEMPDPETSNTTSAALAAELYASTAAIATTIPMMRFILFFPPKMPRDR
jgi:hypothetical protein